MTTGLVANRALKIATLDLAPGQPIPADTWESVPARNRQAMVNTRFVILAGDYAGPPWAPPQDVQPQRKAQKARARKA